MDLNKALQDATETNLAELNEILKKAIISNPNAEIDINTAEESQNELAARGHPWLEKLETMVDGAFYGEEPRSLKLPEGRLLYLSKVDEGLYSGFIKIDDPASGSQGETLTQLSKMTLKSILQALKAKGYLPKEMPQQPQQTVAEALSEALKMYQMPQIHIHVKSDSE